MGDHHLTIDRISTKNLLIQEERSIQSQKQEENYRVNIDNLKNTIQIIEQDRDDKLKLKFDELKTLNEKLELQNNKIQIVSEQIEDERRKTSNLETQLINTDNLIKNLKYENEKQEKENKDILKEIEI